MLPARARTLFVTCLRDPIRRQISEYWYAGSGYKGVIDCGRNASRCAERGAENNVMGDASWHAWMDKTTELAPTIRERSSAATIFPSTTRAR